MFDKSNFKERIQYEMEICSLQTRLQKILAPNVLQIFETHYEGLIMYEDSMDVINEVNMYLDLLVENFVPQYLTEFYINIPVATLDYSELVTNLCPSSNLSMYNYELLAFKLAEMFTAEKNFYEQISQVIMKIMQKQILNDTDNQISSVTNPFFIDVIELVENSYKNLPRQRLQQQNEAS